MFVIVIAACAKKNQKGVAGVLNCSMLALVPATLHCTGTALAEYPDAACLLAWMSPVPCLLIARIGCSLMGGNDAPKARSAQLRSVGGPMRSARSNTLNPLRLAGKEARNAIKESKQAKQANAQSHMRLAILTGATLLGKVCIKNKAAIHDARNPRW